MTDPENKKLILYRLTEVEKKVTNIDKKLEGVYGLKTEILSLVSKLDIYHRDSLKARELIQKDLDNHQERIRQLEKNQSKIVWAIIISILMAVIEFTLRGGLKQ